MATPLDLLNALAQIGAEARCDGDELRIRAPRGRLGAELQSEIRNRKSEIIAHLRREASQAPRTSEPGSTAQPTNTSVSFGQARLLFLERLQKLGSAYNMSMSFCLHGVLDAVALQRSIEALIARHEMLRTRFAMINGTLSQLVEPACHFQLDVHSPAPDGPADREFPDQNARRVVLREPFRLDVAPLMRAALFRVSSDQAHLFVVMHHIIADGWSLRIFLRELTLFYNDIVTGSPQSVPPVQARYADFVAWQRSRPQIDEQARHALFWRQRLAGVPGILELPADRPRPAEPTYLGASHGFRVGKDIMLELESLAHEERATLFMVLLAAFQILLFRLSGQNDFLIGTPVAGRANRKFENIIGLFANTAVVRSNLGGDPNFRLLLRRVRDDVLEDYAHWDYPFESLVADMKPERRLAYHPLFQVMLSVVETPLKPPRFLGLSTSHLPNEQASAKFDITLHVQKTADGLNFSINYADDLFRPDTIERWSGHLQTLLDGIVAQGEAPISKLPLISEHELDQVLRHWTNAGATKHRFRSVVDLFSRQVEIRREAVALIQDKESLTYEVLDERSNQVARHILAADLGPRPVVGLYLRRSVNLVVVLLGILKAGASYLPLDPAYPERRLREIAADAAVRLVVVENSSPALGWTKGIACLNIDAAWPQILQRSTATLGDALDPRALAYVIYTSGSTGKPKGVMIEHRNLASVIETITAALDLQPSDTLASITSPSFDIFGLELFGPLCCGARLELVAEEITSDASRMAAFLEERRISVMQATPMQWRLLLAEQWYLPRLKALCGGDVLTSDLATELAQRCGSLWNLYGPTECTIWATISEVTETRYGIGRPMRNVEAFVLDAGLNVVPTGVVGDLYLGGDGVGRGYLGRPAQTAASFLPSPFGTGERFYKTGDLARWLPDGSLDFRGRRDAQVKVRGFRIECGEVETGLIAHAEIAAAFVTIYERAANDRELVAYVVPRNPGAPPAPDELRRHLLARLPAYMVPANFIPLDALPMTVSGKLERSRLPDPQMRKHVYVAPRTDIETTLARCWAEALSVRSIGIDDQFFEIGGDSLSALRIQWLARQRGLRFDLRDLFEAPSIRDIARRITTVADNDDPGDSRLTSDVDLLPSQRRFFEEQSPAVFDSWHLRAAVESSQRLDIDVLDRCLETVVSDHQSLQARFFETADGWKQGPSPQADRNLTAVHDLIGLTPEQQQGRIEKAYEEAQRQLDIASGHTLKLLVFRIDRACDRLLLIVHHLAADGYSVDVIVASLLALYKSRLGEASSVPRSPSLQLSSLVDQLKRDALELEQGTDAEFWLRQAEQGEARLRRDRPEPAGPAHPAVVSTSIIGGELADIRSGADRRDGLTVEKLVLAAFCQALKQAFEAPALYMSLNTSGRSGTWSGLDLSGLVGCVFQRYPVLISSTVDTAIDATAGDVLLALDALPPNPCGYDVMRYFGSDARLRKRLADALPPQLEFNYNRARGRRPGAFRRILLYLDPLPCREFVKSESFSLSVAETKDTMYLDLIYDPSAYLVETADALLNSTIIALKSAKRVFDLSV